MHLNEPLLRLPIRFDADVLRREIDALPPQAWTEHPQGYQGNDAVRLATAGGALSDAIGGDPMAPTEYLKACPYIMAVMAAIGGVWGRVRLMRLAPDAGVPPHVDSDFYWRTHVRLHVPITTTPDVLFTCADETVHMAAGECWIFDTFARHRVQNGRDAMRVHLVMDTVGGEGLWDLVQSARVQPDAEPRLVPPGSGVPALAFEEKYGPPVMSPWELLQHIAFLRERSAPSPAMDALLLRLDRLAAGWHGIWAQHGPSPDAVPAYMRLIAELGRDLNGHADIGTLLLPNQMPVMEHIGNLIQAMISRSMLVHAARGANGLRAVPGGR
ncbi:aspartyl/asparaginyl beta-hydroxylase domain-containing protein [Sphingomonas oryzagri]